MDTTTAQTDSVSIVIPHPAPPPPPPIEEVETSNSVERSETNSPIEEVKNTSTGQKKGKTPIKLPKKNEYKFGKLVYDIPDTMILKKVYTIIFRINRDTNDISITNNLGPKTKIKNIKSSDEMEVEIVDPTSNSFLIVKNNSDIQLIDSTGYTEWVYDITPNKSGKLKLNIIVSTIRKNGKKQVVYFDDVYVKSNPIVVVKTFWEKYWQWIFSTIFIPLTIWLYNRKKKKKR